jgi:6-phosphofructokinase
MMCTRHARFAGAKCGFLAAMGALAAGAHRAFIPEERASLKDIKVFI